MKKTKSVLLTTPYILWMVAFTLIPLGVVAYYALTDPATGEFSLTNIRELGMYLPVLGSSIWYSLVSSAICLLLGYPVAYYIAHRSPLAQKFLYMLVMLPMCMSFLLRTLAWVGILPLYSTIVKIDHRLIEAAQDLGCNGRKVFSKVILPLSMPGILSGVTMVFVPAVSTFYISQKLGGTDTVMIGDVIERQFKQGNNPNLGAALSLVLMILVFVCTGIMNRFGGDEEGGVIA